MFRPCCRMPNQPKWPMASDIRMFAVIVRPANGPAPTLSTNGRAMMTAKAPMRPPSGAHHGIDAMPFGDGIGFGWHNHSTSSNARTGRNETVLASREFSSDVRSAPFIGDLRSLPFIGGPPACSAPASRMSG